MWAGIAGAVQIILFFLGLWGERNSKRAKVKAEIAKEIVDAFAETNKKRQASKFNAVVGRLGRV